MNVLIACEESQRVCIESECKDDLHEAFHLFLSDRGY